MRITRSDNDALVIVDFPYWIGAIAFPTAAIMLAAAAVALYWRSAAAAAAAVGRPAPLGDIVGPAVGALICFAGGAFFTKRSEFRFDRAARLLTWRRRGLFTRVGGVLPFDQVRRALVDAHADGDGGPTYAIVLATDAGRIPLTDAYWSGARAKYDAIRDAINATLSVATTADEQVETEILELALAGRKIDAVALARKRYGYDLAQAEQFVDGLAT